MKAPPICLAMICCDDRHRNHFMAVGQSANSAIANFYSGKQLRVIIRSEPGGGYDLYARLLARFIGDHIPGKPAVIRKTCRARVG